MKNETSWLLRHRRSVCCNCTTLGGVIARTPGPVWWVATVVLEAMDAI